MSLSLLSNATAIGTNVPTPFSGIGGTPPYVYSVVAGGAGGTINPSTGLYTSPAVSGVDVIKVTDSLLTTATTSIAIMTALNLFCDVIETEMGLANGRVYLWDQKIMQPKDSGLYIAVGVISCRPFSNINTPDGSGSGLDSVQSTNFFATLSVDIISRGPEARDRKEEVIMALNSNYAQTQQELNSFYIAKISSSFLNLSAEDGAAIPYRFNISVNLQYAVRKINPVAYYDQFQDAEVNIDP